MVGLWGASVQLRTAGLLLELFHFDLSGDALAKLETFEGEDCRKST